MTFHLGLDFGTSGARACVVDETRNIIHEDRFPYPFPDEQTPLLWREALLSLLRHLPAPVASQLRGIAIDATSATVLLCDAELRPISPVLIYSDNRAQEEASQLSQLSPPGHSAISATSGLAKFLWLTRHTDLFNAAHFMHQADWLTALLTRAGGVSDYHNALKTGYDVQQLCWPEWILQLPHSHLLPQVVPPGSILSQINPDIAEHFRIDPECQVHAGTTDSIAAFIATGASQPGEAVTSLGSTIVLKLISQQYVDAAQYGIYSHRYGGLWLAGGASNAGGAVLREYFSDEQLTHLSASINPETAIDLDYYPLNRPGERFPVNDPALKPRLTPRPAEDAHFLHGLLLGLSRIEADGYDRLAELGATPLHSVVTCGGGAKNPTWTKIREKLIGVPVRQSQYSEAAYGAALLAKRGALE